MTVYTTTKESQDPYNIEYLFFISVIFCGLLFGLSLYTGYYLAPNGRDFTNYDRYYQSFTPLIGPYSAGGERFEIGFKFICFLFSKIIPSNTRLFYSFLVFIALFAKYVVALKFFRLNVWKVFILIILYSVSFLLVFEANQIREAIAIPFGFLSIYFFYKNRYLLAFFFISIAFIFHYTSIIFLVGLAAVFLIKRKQFSVLLIIITAITLISEYIINIFKKINPIVIEYSKNYEGFTFSFWNLTFILAFIFFIYHFLYLKKENVLNNSLLIFLFTGLMIYLVIDIPVYQIRILELTEVSCLLISLNRKFASYYDTGSFILLLMLLTHKMIAFIFINPLIK